MILVQHESLQNEPRIKIKKESNIFCPKKESSLKYESKSRSDYLVFVFVFVLHRLTLNY